MGLLQLNQGDNKSKPIRIGLWILFYLIALDVAVNLIFRFPTDPEKTPPSFLQGYFEYGRSVEGKLDRMTSRASAKTDGILGYGWLRDKRFDSQPREAGKHQTLVAVYGMSHTKLLAEAMAKIDDKYVIRDVTAPGAPANWSYAAYEFDKDHHAAKVVIMGVMTDNVPYLGATAGTTSFFDMSHPYTFPRYLVEENHLKKTYPPFFTSDGFKDYFYNPGKWEEYRAWLAKNDKYYDAVLFRRSITDMSALLRVLRRAYAQKFKESKIKQIYTRDGFNTTSDEMVALRGIIKEFGQSCRRQNQLPIVYIVNNEGRSDHLHRALQPVLEANKIPYLSTHTICPPDDPRLFLGINSHFIPSKDIELAKEIIKLIEKNGFGPE